jgi:adenylate kinase family enzyme
VQVAVHLSVPHEELIRRILNRGRGEEDIEEVITHRLKVYANAPCRYWTTTSSGKSSSLSPVRGRSRR